MYTFWTKSFTNSTLKSKLNVWYMSDIRSFNILSSSNLSYLITTLNKPKLNIIKTHKSSKNLDYFIIYLLYLIIIAVILLKLFI